MKKIRKKLDIVFKKAQNVKIVVVNYIKKNPIKSFYIVLSILIILIILGNILRTTKKKETREAVTAKKVKVYKLQDTPQIRANGTIRKSGVIEIVAQAPAIVQKIHVTEGSRVRKGALLLSLASNYQGGNALAAQRQIAAVQYQNSLDTYDMQKNAILKQKDIAQKTYDNANEMRDITKQSIDETKSLISLNESIISSLDSSLSTLELDPVTNAAVILSTKQLKSQYVSVLNQTKSGMRQSEYQVNGDKPQTKLNELQKEVTQNQLDIQLKMLDMNVEIGRLQVQLARIAEGTMNPVSPFAGTIQKVEVRLGQSVNPGSVLVVLAGDNGVDSSIIAYVSKAAASQIAANVSSKVYVNNQTVELVSSYTSTDAVLGNLYAIYYTLPKKYDHLVTDGSVVEIDIPFTTSDGAAKDTYIPLDTIHQTSNGAYVFIVDKSRATSKHIKLGEVFGEMVSVDGLNGFENVIVDRTVVDGDRIEVQY